MDKDLQLLLLWIILIIVAYLSFTQIIIPQAEKQRAEACNMNNTENNSIIQGIVINCTFITEIMETTREFP